jgi:hypothetical protein
MLGQVLVELNRKSAVIETVEAELCDGRPPRTSILSPSSAVKWSQVVARHRTVAGEAFEAAGAMARVDPTGIC